MTKKPKIPALSLTHIHNKKPTSERATAVIYHSPQYYPSTIGIREELAKKACSFSFKAHRTGKLYHCEKSRGSSETFFSFPGSWSVEDWFSGRPFGKTQADPELFPSLRSIGNDEVAVVNEAFFRRFKAILRTTSFANEVLEISSLYFIHFVMRYDIVPRLMLAPLSSIEQELRLVLPFFNPKSPSFGNNSIATAREASVFFTNVMRNVSSVASHTACNLMGSTNPLLETVTSFIELSPYRPFGTYVFCTGNGKQVVVQNSDAVLQVLLYSCHLECEVG